MSLVPSVEVFNWEEILERKVPLPWILYESLVALEARLSEVELGSFKRWEPLDKNLDRESQGRLKPCDIER